MVYFQVADLERPIRAAGLEFRQIGRDDFPPGSLLARDEELGRLTGRAALRCGLSSIERKAEMLFRDAPVSRTRASSPSTSSASSASPLGNS